MNANTIGLLEPSIRFNVQGVGPLLAENAFPAGYTISVDLILTNPTEWDWTYTVRCWLGPDPPAWWPIIVQQDVTVPAGQSVTLTNEAFTFPAATGLYYPQAEAWEKESQVYLGLFDFLPITLLTPPPPTSESITLEWVNAQPFYCGSEQWYALTHTNLDYVPLSHHYLLCSCASGDAFDTSLGCAFPTAMYGLDFAVGQIHSFPQFAIMGDIPGTYRVWIEVYSSSSRLPAELLGVIELGTVELIAAPAPQVDMTLNWGVAGPPGEPELLCSQVGDLNDDGQVNSLDLTLLELAIIGSITLEPWQIARADVDNNGIVDGADLQLLMQYIAGTITTFPHPACGY